MLKKNKQEVIFDPQYFVLPPKENARDFEDNVQ